MKGTVAVADSPLPAGWRPFRLEVCVRAGAQAPVSIKHSEQNRVNDTRGGSVGVHMCARPGAELLLIARWLCKLQFLPVCVQIVGRYLYCAISYLLLYN